MKQIDKYTNPIFPKTLKEGLGILFELIFFLAKENIKVFLLEGGAEVLRKVGEDFEINANKKNDNYFPFYILKPNN